MVSAWFAHRAGGVITHIEVRGPTFKGSLTGGRKTLFRFGRGGQGCRRLVATEAPIDALSIAAIEGVLPRNGLRRDRRRHGPRHDCRHRGDADHHRDRAGTLL